MDIQFDYADGSQCLPAGQPASSETAPTTVWETMQAGVADNTGGYFVVHNYFDPATGQPVGKPAAAVGIAWTINNRLANGRFDLRGGAIGTVTDPNASTYGAVAFGS